MWPDMGWMTNLFSDTWWIAKVFGVVFGCMVLNFIVRRIIDRLYVRLEQTRSPWDDAVFDAASRPLSCLIWLMGISFAAVLVRQKTHADVFDLIEPARRVGVVIIAAWFLIRVIKRVEQNIIGIRQSSHGHEIDRTTLTAISNLGRVSVIVTAVLISMESLGYSVSGILAFGGVGGLAIGFAAKDMLANLFGSLLVFMDRPFQIGDWIRSPDREIEGTVEHIGWRVTRIRTPDKRALYVPNALFSTIAIENPSRMTNRRIKETIGLRYADFHVMEAVINDVRDTLLRHPEIDAAQGVTVSFDTFGASALEFLLYCFTKTTDFAEYHAIKQEILFQVGRIVEQHGAEMAFPSTSLYVPDGIEFRLAGKD